jgi:predicted transcriptional regulator
MKKVNAAAPTLIARVTRLWARLVNEIDEYAQRHAAAWGATLQYKRRYTNPDEAKRFRRPIGEM